MFDPKRHLEQGSRPIVRKELASTQGPPVTQSIKETVETQRKIRREIVRAHKGKQATEKSGMKAKPRKQEHAATPTPTMPAQHPAKRGRESEVARAPMFGAPFYRGSGTGEILPITIGYDGSS